MPHEAVPGFVAKPRESEAVAARALEFSILCASRTAEVVEARWPEIDRGAKLWTIPAERMKAGWEHRVPLCARALAILDTAEKMRVGEYVFPGQLRNKPLSNMAMAMLMRRSAPRLSRCMASAARSAIGQAKPPRSSVRSQRRP